MYNKLSKPGSETFPKKYRKGTARYGAIVTGGSLLAAILAWMLFNSIHAAYLTIGTLLITVGATIRYNQ